MMQYKSLSDGAIKDVDSVKGVVTGYLSRFGNVDAHNDIMASGCYSKSIQENGPQSAKPRIHYLWNHSDKVVGKFTELREDNFGLYFEAQIIKALKAGEDALIYYAEGIVNEHSVGFKPEKYAFNSDDDDKPSYMRQKTFTEVKLYEGSAVLWGANEDTPMTSLKGMDASSYVEKLKTMQKLLRKGNLSDESCQLLEIQAAQIEGFLKSLETQEEPRKHSEEPKPIDLVSLWRSV